MKARSATIEDPAALEALAHPLRKRILTELRSPGSAAAIARVVGLPRQKVNYHLRALASAGLVLPAGERRKGHLVEKLYQAAAGSFVISPRVSWDGERRQMALNDQVSLQRLVDLGEQLQLDAAGLIDRAAFDGEHIASASVEAAVRFESEADRSAFMEDYLAALGPLLEKHGARQGAPFRLVLAVYPESADQHKQEI